MNLELGDQCETSRLVLEQDRRRSLPLGLLTRWESWRAAHPLPCTVLYCTVDHRGRSGQESCLNGLSSLSQFHQTITLPRHCPGAMFPPEYRRAHDLK